MKNRTLAFFSLLLLKFLCIYALITLIFSPTNKKVPESEALGCLRGGNWLADNNFLNTTNEDIKRFIAYCESLEKK